MVFYHGFLHIYQSMSMASFILSGVDDKVLITVCVGAVLFLLAISLMIFRRQNSTRPNTAQNRTENHQSYNNDVCPICLGVHRLAVKTNCGHEFCGSCVKNYLSRSSGDFILFRSPLSCPLCRQEVNILLLCFTQEDATSAELEEEKIVVERVVHEYNARFGGGPRTLWSYVTDCPVLIQHMLSDFFTFGGLVWMFRLRVVLCCFGAFIYLFNPLDIIPEAVFGVFGFLDDILIFLLCVIYMSIIYRRLIISRANART